MGRRVVITGLGLVSPLGCNVELAWQRLLAGERDPEVLAAFRDIRCHASVEVIKAALVGNDRDEHIFALSQSLDLYDFYQAKIADCDRKLEAAVAALTIKARPPISDAA